MPGEGLAERGLQPQRMGQELLGFSSSHRGGDVRVRTGVQVSLWAQGQ